MSEAKTWIEISRESLKKNIQALFLIAGDAEVMPVIKANAYGHGLLQTARVLIEEGVNWLAVDSLREALDLRAAGYKEHILILGLLSREALKEAIENDISFVLFNMDQLTYIEGRKGERRARIHIPVETGLYREGFELEEFKEILDRVKTSASISLEGIQTHFANIEDATSDEYADQQLAEYGKYLEIMKEYNIGSIKRHTAASAAAILYSKTTFDLIRPGIAIYGLWPSSETKRAAIKSAPELKLLPALTWKTLIAQVKYVKAGERVGYGLTERLEQDSKIAVLPIGYYDGFDRVGMSSKAHVLVSGKRCKIIGRICMNMCMADVTNISGVKAGDEVVLLGKQKEEEITADEMAERMHSINYEVVARLGAHIERRLI